MRIQHSKIVIIGAGTVGVTTAYSLLNQGVCDEICLIDLDADKVYGEVLDLSQSVEFMNRNVAINVGTYADCQDANILIITASAPMTKTDNNRLDMLEKSKSIMKSIITSVMKNNFDGYMIIVSNPVDIMSYYAYKLSGLPSNQVIGSGTTLDAARLKGFIGKKVDVDSRSVNAMVIGEHGDSELIPWGTVTIGGKDIYSIVEDNVDRIGDSPYEMLHQAVIKAGWEIFNRKGNTCYGIASAVSGIVKTIMFNENRVYPVSTLLQGEYGETDIYTSIPAILNRNGVKEIVKLKLSASEKEAFHASCENIRKYYKNL